MNWFRAHPVAKWTILAIGPPLAVALVVRMGSDSIAKAVVDQAVAPFVRMLWKVFQG